MVGHFRLILLYNYTFYSRHNTEWIANTEIVLDPNNSIVKRLWCSYCINSLKVKRLLTKNFKEIDSKGSYYYLRHFAM